MRTSRHRGIERECHFIENALQIANRYATNDVSTLVADDIGFIATHDAVETTATLRSTEFRVRESGSYDIHEFRMIRCNCNR